MLFGNDLYVIEKTHSIGLNDMRLLTSLYQPLLSPLAMCLYFNLLQMYKDTQRVERHHILCEKLHCSIDELETARHELEHLLLLKSYLDSSGKTQLFCYVLQLPKTEKEFLHHQVFSRLLYEQMGELYIKSLTEHDELDNFEEISEYIKYDFVDWNEAKEQVLVSIVEDQLDKGNEDPYGSYDFLGFLERRDSLGFLIPRSKLEPDVLALINYYGILYSIDEESMLRCVNNAFDRQDPDNPIFVKSKFMGSVLHNAKSHPLKEKSYTVRPFDFVQFLSPHCELTFELKLMLTKLQTQLELSDELMNVVIEKTWNSLDPHELKEGYMIKVAKTLKHANIQSAQAALARYEKHSDDFLKLNDVNKETTKTPTKARKFRRVEKIPTYQKDDDIKQVDLDELQERLKKLKS